MTPAAENPFGHYNCAWDSPCIPARNTLPSYTMATPSRGCFFGWRLVIMGSWLNILTIFIPITFIMRIIYPNAHGLTFIFSVLSLIPLVKFHDVSTRELAIRIGGSKTGLVNASLSNVIEIVVAISALRKCELRVVQSSLIGSMLSKLLLVLGLCLFAGGIRFSEQGIDPTATQLNSSLLSLGVGVVLLPAAYHFALSGNSDIESQLQMKNILSMSHGVSIILLFIYGSYLFFQLCSHTHLYKDGNKRSSARLEDFLPPRSKFSQGELRLSPPRNIYFSPRSSSETTLPILEQHSKSGGGLRPGLGGVEMSRDDTFSRSLGNESSCSLVEKWQLQFESTLGTVEERQPQLSMIFISLILTVVTVAVAFTADRLVESMDSISSTIPKPYVALIILPAINSVAECMTGVNASAKDELNFAISVAVGSTIQTALFVIPFMVTLAWAMGKPLALLFDPFESLVLYISVQVSTYVMADGKSNYLEGMVLLCTWTIISVSFWFYPAWSLPSSFAVCRA